MVKAFVLWGTGGGFVLALCYICYRLRAGKAWNPEDAMSVAGSGLGFAGAVQLLSVTVAHMDREPVSGIFPQMILGGLALAFIAVSSAVKKFKGD